LLSPDAVYFFSHGTYRGQAEIRQAFEQTWDRIQNETYRIQDVTWLVQSEQTAVFTYTYRWDGWIDGKHQSGGGRGTNVLIGKKTSGSLSMNI
jgi:ketosteroid isomerase-like protein